MWLHRTSARTQLCLLAALMIASTLLSAAAPPTGAQAQPAQPLTLDQLKNATYPSQFTASRLAPLKNGAYSEPAAPGSASLVSVTFVDAAIAPDFAAVVLASSGGGSGTFYTLHIVSGQGGTLSVGAGVLIGDRIRLGSLAIDNGRVRLALTMSGPNDPACCPTLQVTQLYGFDARGFRLLSTTPLSTQPPPPTQALLPAATGSAGLGKRRDAAVIEQLGLLLALALAVGCARLAVPRGSAGSLSKRR